MNTKHVSKNGKLFGSVLAILIIVTTSLHSPMIHAQAQENTVQSPARMAAAPYPDQCPNPAYTPNTPELFFDDMESSGSNWEFKANGSTYTSDWSIITAAISSPTLALNGPDQIFENDSYASMKTDVSLPAEVASYLYFYHSYIFEAQGPTEGYDGGVLEYSIDRGANWKTDVDLLFSAGQNYNATIKVGYQNPLQGRSAFSEHSGGVVATRYDLTSLGGQTIRFRWRTGSEKTGNGGNFYPGWIVDDVSIYTCDTVVKSVTRVSPSPTNLASVNFTVQFSRPVTGVDIVGPIYDDFSLATSGLTGAAITSASGTGDTYTVTVSTGTGNGSIRLDVGTSGIIIDSLTNPLVGTYTAGETYGVLRSTIFADVPPAYWANRFIERLYVAGVTGGCSVNPALAYCPDAIVTRGQMAVFLLRGIHGSSYVPPAATGTKFIDVPSSYWAAAWIEQLAAEGITSGCGPNTYCPDTTVTRGQMAVFLMRGKHGAGYAPPAGTGFFTDVSLSYWAVNWIEQLSAENITGGCSVIPLAYCPETPVTRSQMAVFLVKTFSLP